MCESVDKSAESELNGSRVRIFVDSSKTQPCKAVVNNMVYPMTTDKNSVVAVRTRVVYISLVKKDCVWSYGKQCLMCVASMGDLLYSKKTMYRSVVLYRQRALILQTIL